MPSISETLVVIPLLRDRFPNLMNNYGYLFRAGDRVVCVDCAVAAPILEVLNDHDWALTDILLTHHHWDHVDGVADLVAATGAKVWGHEKDAHRLPPLDHALSAGDVIEISGHRAEIWDVSGHTLNHIAFIFEGIAFTGDSLMVAGCGRLFEGSPDLMFNSLMKFKDLPDETLIASGHEYTLDNLAFALSLEPDNGALISQKAKVEGGRAANRPSVPSPLSVERNTNPFLRCHMVGLKAATGTIGQSDTDTFAAARRAKDAF